MPRPERPVPAPVHRRSRAVPVAAAVVSAALTLLLGSGYAVGRSVVEAAPQDVPRASVSAWQATGGVMPAGATSVEQLRTEGWTLPALASDGYQVVSVTVGTLAGRPVVTVRLQRGEDDVVVVEQRGRVDPGNPVDGLTGLPVSAEGLERSAVAGVPLWVGEGPPWRAVVVGHGVVYTVTADTSPAAMSHTLGLVVADERGRVEEPPAGEPGVARTVVAGLREIFG